MTGRLPAREALSLIAWLPRGSAYRALWIEANGLPDEAEDGASRQSMAWFEWTREVEMASFLWNLIAAFGAGGSGSPPRFPDPTQAAREWATDEPWRTTSYEAAVAEIKARQAMTAKG